MYDEIIAAIAKLTAAVNGVSATLGIILVVLVLKETNSSSAVRSLGHDLRNIGAAISALSSNVTAVLRRNGGQEDG